MPLCPTYLSGPCGHEMNNLEVDISDIDAPIFEHSGTDEPSDRSDRNESPEETDSSFFHPSYIQACPVHDRHRCLRQTREFRQPRELHRINAMSESSARIRLFFYKIDCKDIDGHSRIMQLVKGEFYYLQTSNLIWYY
ncbi:uncharacterized protein LOC143344921 [Colletes latitarsis]|uniref:uncharacterized protein LOC143344921 n=1 Tax=Colletes latitarsis TaxID=2605962 RepID=UPI004035C19D